MRAVAQSSFLFYLSEKYAEDFGPDQEDYDDPSFSSTNQYQDSYQTLEIKDPAAFLTVQSTDVQFSSGDDGKLFVCPLCQKSFYSESGLRHHKTTHLPPRHHCQVCQITFHHRSSLKRHLATLHGLACCFSCFETFPKDKRHLHVCKK